jgi:hypothetical protein
MPFDYDFILTQAGPFSFALQKDMEELHLPRIRKLFLLK